MPMPTYAIQYLEDSPQVAALPVRAARERLRDAFSRLPLDMVLIGWRLPEALLDVCAEECERAGAALYRWHPLLTSDGTFMPRVEWGVIGLDGMPIPGFRNMPEFTFVCPNRAGAASAVLDNLDRALAGGRYRGVFLDRIRWPSPAADPARHLGCFCPGCQRAAAEDGLDLVAAREQLIGLLDAPGGPARFARILLDPEYAQGKAVPPLIRALMTFRVRSVTAFVERAIGIARARGLAVGLDGFSPALAHMVGQDLAALDRGADWTKIMSYGHTLGPAGMPFELLGLADWLVERGQLAESETLRALAAATRLPLPAGREALRREGLPSQALQREVERARAGGLRTLLAGIELVDIAGITALDKAQIRADLAAFRAGGADGLALSWDLWEIPLERLDLVREVWEDQ